MENRASYALVGAFVLALLAGLFVFVVWLAKVQFDQASQPYYIYFTGTVTGLVEGSPVRYRGVSVGTVTDIRIDPENVERVRVTVEVPEDTPIKADAVASLEPVGVTGGVYVEIAGGSQDAPLLATVSEGIPVIQSRPSSIAEVLAQAPQLLNNLIVISERLAGFMTPANQQAFAAILGNVAQASEGADLALKDLRTQVATVSAEATKLLASANRTVTNVGDNAGQISADLAATSAELRRLTVSLVETSNQLGAMIKENREPIRDFTNETLYEVAALLIQLQDLAANLSRVTSRLERDPSELIFGTDGGGVEVK